MSLSGNPKDAIGRTKAPLHLIPSPALVEIAKAMQVGADKYGPYNWRESAVARTVYLAAAERHIRADLDGETFDPAAPDGERIYHLAFACAGLMVLLDAILVGKMIDDRPPPGVAGALMRKEPLP